jgi:vacuolar-type H+-ATPase subunit E/Vma4
MEQAMNKEIAAAANHARKLFIALRKNYIDKLFNEIANALNEFVNSPEYQNYLSKKIEKHAGDFSVIQLMQRDAGMDTGLTVVITDEDFIGGFRLKTNEIVADYTMAAELDVQRKEFPFIYNNSHE